MAQRQAWFADHADTLAYRDELKAAVAERRHELGVRAAITQPDHVVAIIGSVPTNNPEATRSWINSAARIEAYREEWAVAPERLRERPRDACQKRAWDVAVRTTELLADRCPDGAWSGAWITGWSSDGEQVGNQKLAGRASTPMVLTSDARARQGFASPACRPPLTAPPRQGRTECMTTDSSYSR